MPERRLLRVPLLALLVSAGCYAVDEDDAGPAEKDGGVIDLSRDAGPTQERDAGPQPDAGPPPPPPDAGPPVVEILAFTVDTSPVAFLSGTTLRWNTRNADGCSIAPDIGSVTLPSGSRYVEGGQPGDSVTYTLTCTGSPASVEASVTVTTALIQHTGNYTANSSAELASLSNINVVTGDLRIQSAANVTELSTLDGLIRVEGNLFVVTNPALTTINLENLAEVGGGLLIDGNAALTSLDLPALEQIGERLYVSRNQLLPPAEISDLVTQVSSAQGILGPVVDYYNDPTSVIGATTAAGGALDQTLLCTPDEQTVDYVVDLFPDGSFVAVDASSALYSGTYKRYERHLQLTFPPQTNVPGGLVATATSTEIEYDRVSAALFGSTLGACYLGGLQGTGFATTRTYTCPSTTVGGVEEHNQIVVSPDGVASWTNRRVVSPDEQIVTLPGAYVVDGEWVYFAFPTGVQAPTPVRFPLARRSVDGTQLDFLDLLAAQTPCVEQ